MNIKPITTQERADKLQTLVYVAIGIYFKEEAFQKNHEFYEIESSEGICIFSVFTNDEGVKTIDICVALHNRAPYDLMVPVIQDWAKENGVEYTPTKRYPYCTCDRPKAKGL